MNWEEDEQRQRFYENPTVNPRTNKRIKIGSKIYNELVDYYGVPPRKPIVRAQRKLSLPKRYREDKDTPQTKRSRKRSASPKRVKSPLDAITMISGPVSWYEFHYKGIKITFFGDLPFNKDKTCKAKCVGLNANLEVQPGNSACYTITAYLDKLFKHNQSVGAITDLYLQPYIISDKPVDHTDFNTELYLGRKYREFVATNGDTQETKEILHMIAPDYMHEAILFFSECLGPGQCAYDENYIRIRNLAHNVEGELVALDFPVENKQEFSVIYHHMEPNTDVVIDHSFKHDLNTMLVESINTGASLQHIREQVQDLMNRVYLVLNVQHNLITHWELYYNIVFESENHTENIEALYHDLLAEEAQWYTKTLAGWLRQDSVYVDDREIHLLAHQLNVLRSQGKHKIARRIAYFGKILFSSVSLTLKALHKELVSEIEHIYKLIKEGVSTATIVQWAKNVVDKMVFPVQTFYLQVSSCYVLAVMFSNLDGKEIVVYELDKIVKTYITFFTDFMHLTPDKFYNGDKERCVQK